MQPEHSSPSIDLNCDMGEGFGMYAFGHDELLLPWISSANIACGFHAGDPSVMRRTVLHCLQAGVSIGAHPGLPDLQGFGRRKMTVTADEVYELTLYQIGALDAFVRAEGGHLRHVKPHGALYHMAEAQSAIAEAIVRAASRYDDRLVLYGLSGGRLVSVAERCGVPFCREAFADRRYKKDGSLLPRTEAGSVLEEPKQAAVQAVMLARDGFATTIEGEQVSIKADSICIHGDGPQATESAQSIHRALTKSGIKVSPASAQ